MKRRSFLAALFAAPFIPGAAKAASADEYRIAYFDPVDKQLRLATAETGQSSTPLYDPRTETYFRDGVIRNADKSFVMDISAATITIKD